jgi:hypothetical protein
VRLSRLCRKPPLPILNRGWGEPGAAQRIVGGVSASPRERTREPWSHTGEVWTNAGGRAVVVLPPFTRAHRAGFEYQLTPLGAACSANVAEEIVDGRFTIVSDEPHVKVAWRVTALKEELP